MSNPTRQQLLEAARDLYAQHGPEGLSMRKVAQRVGVSATAIYRHYADKETLVMAVCEEGFRLFELSLMRGMRAKAPLDRLRMTGQGYLDFALEHPSYYRVMFMAAHPEFKKLQQESALAYSPSFQFLIDRVSECQRAGLLRQEDPQMTALSLWAHCHGLIALWLDELLPAPEAEADEAEAAPNNALSEPALRALYTRHVDTLLQGLLRPPSAHAQA